MSLVLYELAAADPEVRFSPYCWKTRMALAHKGLEPERRPWRFVEKEAIAFSGQGRVPVLVDGEETVSNSWTIAEHLERRYPDAPSLFPGGTEPVRFLDAWGDQTLLPALARVVVPDVHEVLDEGDKDYFKSSREERFGVSFEQLRADRDKALANLRSLLPPLRSTLKDGGYLAGETPGYADYCLFGHFMWADVISSVAILEADDPIARWRDSLMDAFGGMARSAPRSAAA